MPAAARYCSTGTPSPPAPTTSTEDVTAGGEGLAAMRGAHADPHRQFTDAECAHAVHAGRARHAEAGHGLGDDAFALLDRQCLERLVLEALHGAALVVVAHPTLEAGVAARRGIGEGVAVALGLERPAAEAERVHQPPATGGMNTTRSPAVSGRDHSANWRCGSA